MMRNWLYFGLFAAAVVGCKKKDEEEGDALTSLDTSILDEGWDLGGGLDSILKSD